MQRPDTQLLRKGALCSPAGKGKGIIGGLLNPIRGLTGLSLRAETIVFSPNSQSAVEFPEMTA